jgi:hypothetical protein
MINIYRKYEEEESRKNTLNLTELSGTGIACFSLDIKLPKLEFLEYYFKL